MLAVLPIASAISPLAHAATTETWTGVAGDGSWNTPTNWSTTTPIAGDSIIFSTATGTTANLTDDVNASFVALSFGSGAAAFTINPGASTTLTLTGALTDSSANGNLENFASGLTISGAGLAYSGAGNSKLAFNNGAAFSGALTDTSNGATADSLAIGAGQTVSLAGASVIGAAAGTANTTTSLTLTGSSTSILTTSGNVTLGGGNNTGTGASNNVNLDLSGVGVFNMTGTSSVLNIGSTSQTNAVMTLANTSNTLNVASINVGNVTDTISGTANSTLPYASTLHLGAGTNTLDATTISIGNGPNGTLNFAGANGSVAIAGLNGGVGTAGANITIGTGRDTTTTSPVQTSTLNLAGHTANINANIVTLGLNNQANYNPGTNVVNVNFDTGTFNAQQLLIGSATQSHARATVTFTLGTNAASTGVLNVNTNFFLQDETFTGADGNQLTANFIINGGTANIHAPIIVAPGGSTKITGTISLQGGTLNMFGNAIGASGNDAQSRPVAVSTFTFPGSGNTATIMNLGTVSNGVGTADGINGLGLTMNGAGTLILDGTNTYGQTTVSSGTIQVGAGGSTGTLGTGAVTDNANLTFNRNDTGLNVSDSISGNGTVKMIGTGTITLSGSDFYTGVTQISSGTLALSSGSNNIASSSAININAGAILDVTQVTGGFSLGGTQNIVNNGTVNGAVTGTGGNIFGNGTYGAVTLNGGNFTAGNATAIGSVTASSLTINSGNLLLKFSGSTADTIHITGSTNLSNSQISIAQLTITTPGTYTVITSGSALSNITAGPLTSIGRTTFAVDSAITSNPDQLLIDVAGGPGNLTWQGTDPSNPTQWDNQQQTHNWSGTAPAGDTTEFFDNDVVNFTGNAQGTINIANTVSPGNINVTAGTYTFTGGNIGGAGTLSVTGGANLTLSNGPANTYTGGTNINSSTVVANAGGAFGTGPVTATNSTLVINNNGALSTALLTLNNATLDNTSGSSVTNLAVTPITISGNVEYLDSNNNADLSLGTGNVTLTVSPIITVDQMGNFILGGNVTGGTNSITKAGTGSLIIGGNTGNYSGGLIINGGSVQVVGTGGKTGLGSGSVTVNVGGTLIGGGGDAFGYTAGSAPQSILINGGTVTDLGSSSYRITLVDVHFTNGGTLTSAAGNGGNTTGNNTGQYSIFGGTIETDASANQALISAGNISLQHGCTTITVAQGTVSGGIDLLVSSNIVNYQTTAGSIIKTGLGTMELSGNNTYTGNTTVSQGTLMLASSTVNDNLTSPVISVASGATLDVTQMNPTGGGFITPSGQTLVNNGNVIGSAAAATGSTITGTGTYGVLSVNGGIITPGTATTVGTLTASSLTVNSGSVKFKFNGALADLLNLTGSTNLTNSEISFGQLASPVSGSFLVLTSTSPLTGIDPSINGGLIGFVGRTTYVIDSADFTANNTQLTIDVTAAGSATLTWTGTDPSNPTSWDNLQIAANWIRTDGGGGDTTHFYDNDSVTFDSTGVQGNINISNTVTPASTTVNSGNYTFNGGTIAGAGGLTVNGGNLTINNNNSFTGIVTLNGGVTSISSIGAVGAGGSPTPLGASGNVATSLVINGGTLQYTGGTVSTDRLFTVGLNGATISSTSGLLTFSNTGNVAFQGSGTHALNLNAGASGSGGGNFASAIHDGGGATSVNITGNGTWSLTGNNTYTGNTTIGAGATLKTGNSTSLGAIAGNAVNVQAGGTLDIGAPTGNNTLNYGTEQFNIAGSGVGGLGAIVNSAPNTPNNFTGSVTQEDAFQNITLTGNATWGGTSRWDMRNGTPILNLNGFTLTKVGSNQISLVGVTFENGGTLDVQSGTVSIETTSNMQGTGNIIYESGTEAAFFETTGNITWNMTMKGNNIIGDNGSLLATIASPVALQGNITFEPLNSSVPTPADNFPLTMTGNITDGGIGASVTKTGVNTTTLSGTNSWSGGTIIQQGTLALAAAGALPTGTALTFSDGTNIGTLDLGGFTETVSALSVVAGSGNGTIGSSSTTSPSTLIFAGNATPSTFGGLIENAIGTGNQTTSLDVTAGSLDLTGSNTYTGNTSVNGGTLIIDTTGSLTSTNIIVNTAGILTIANGGSIPNTTALVDNGIVNMNNSSRVVATLNSTTPGIINLNGTTFSATNGGSFIGTIQDNGTNGKLLIPTGSTLTTDAIKVANLETDGTYIIRANNATPAVSKINALVIPGTYGGSATAPSVWNGALDLTNSKLIVEDTSPALTRAADLAEIKDEALAANTNSGTAGIYSSTANAFNTAAGKIVKVVAVVDNGVRMATFPSGSTNFGGVNNVDANSILVTAAFKGDANLDGVVDIQDLTVVANHWQQTVTDWSQGDFDGSDFVDIQDLTAVANNWQAGVGSGGGSGESFNDALSLIGGFKTAATPEPASLVLLGLGGVVLAGRRRNKR